MKAEKVRNFAMIPIVGEMAWEEVLEMARAVGAVVIIAAESGRIGILSRGAARASGIDGSLRSMRDGDFEKLFPQMDPPINALELAAESPGKTQPKNHGGAR